MNSYDADNTNPYDSQAYESQALPYIPYATSQENTPQSYNVQVNPISNKFDSPAPLYGSTPTSLQNVENPVPPSQPDTPASANPLSPSSTKKRRHWLPLVIATLIILVVAASSFALLTYLNRSTPAKTLDIFCTALQDGKYQTAYDQLTPALQTNFTESQFATVLSSDSVATCSHGAVDEHGTSTTTDLHLYHSKSKGINNDRVVVIKDAHNQWKINDIQSVS